MTTPKKKRRSKIHKLEKRIILLEKAVHHLLNQPGKRDHSVPMHEVTEVRRPIGYTKPK